MKIEIKIDDKSKETSVIIITKEMNEEVNDILKKLSKEEPKMIAGFLNDNVELLDPSNIYHIYSQSGKVYAETNKNEYLLHMRLYEVEEKLSNDTFVRISNSDIINLKKVKNFDLSFVGTICVTLLNGTATYVSRRFVSKIKRQINI